MKFELRVLTGDFEINVINLAQSKYLVGRAPDCHLRPASNMVSRHHCVFKQDQYTLRCRDLGSTNGTFVNNERIQGEVFLKDGDIVQVGDVTLQVLALDVAQLKSDQATLATQGTGVFEGETTIFQDPLKKNAPPPPPAPAPQQAGARSQSESR
jgi:pSer/pThr/pTyr-binding forkhead associated (FHA) protein